MIILGGVFIYGVGEWYDMSQLSPGIDGERRGTDQKASEAVIEAVADREGVDPRDLSETLFEAVDPDALNMICREDSVRISFEYHGYLVTIDGRNNVDLTDVA
jgi:hypothetical protein